MASLPPISPLFGRIPYAAIGRGCHLPRQAFRQSLAALSLCIWGAIFPLIAPAHGAGGDEVIAVYSSVSPGYARTRLPSGAFKLETYAFGEGGVQGGALNDFTIDHLGFKDIARIIAPSLASRNYLPCARSDPAHTDLLIMVYWGTTVGTDSTSTSPEYQIAQSLIPPPPAPMSAPPTGQVRGDEMVSDPSASGRAGEGQVISALRAAADSALQQSLLIASMANRKRDRQDIENAAVLGYLEEMKRLQGSTMTSLNLRRRDLIDEIEESRYFVVLMAYDFQPLLQHKERKLLWETRFSIRQRHNDFSKELAAMTESASRYFGQDSVGLKRQQMRDEHINLGELKILQIDTEGK